MDIHETNSEGQTALHGASGDAVLTKLLLEAGANANAADNEGRTPLHRAETATVVSLLAELGKADINFTAKNGDTPLLSLLSADQSMPSYNKETVLKLLKYGPNCNGVDICGDSPLHVALAQWTSDPELLEILIKAGADPNMPNRDGTTPLLVLGQDSSNSSDIKLKWDVLLANGADINARYRDGANLFFRMLGKRSYKTEKIWLECLKDLMGRGVSFEVRDFKGRTGLFEIVKCGPYSCCGSAEEGVATVFEFLVGLGHDIHAVDYAGNTLLHELAKCSILDSSSSPFAPWRKLVELGLDLEKKSHAGRTPLHILCELSSAEIRITRKQSVPIDYLIQNVKNIDVADHEGVTPLHLAIIRGEIYTKKLLDAGADPTAATHENITPLHIACRCRDSNCAGLILDALALKNGKKTVFGRLMSDQKMVDQGGNEDLSSVMVGGVDAKTHADSECLTPLHYACRSGRIETVLLLLEAGANVNDPGSNYFNACEQLVEENALWRHSSHLSENHGYEISKAHSCARPNLIRRDGDLTSVGKHKSARVEEIKEVLTRLGAMDDRLNSTMRKNWLKTLGSSPTGIFSEKLKGATKGFSTKMLREPGYIKPGTSHSEHFMYFLRRGDYDQVVELAALGANFLADPDPNQNEASNFSMLVKEGFTELAKRVARAMATKRGCIDSDGHVDYSFLFMKGNFDEATEQYAHFKGEKKVTPYLLDALMSTTPNMEMVRLLVVTFGADVNQVFDRPWNSEHSRERSTYEPLLIYASGEGASWWHVNQALPYLIKAGADINVNWNGRTLLHSALGREPDFSGFYNKEARKLVEVGADVNVLGPGGRSNLSVARHHTDLLSFFMDHGAVVKPDALAAVIGISNADGLEVLLSRGADPNMREFVA